MRLPSLTLFVLALAGCAQSFGLAKLDQQPVGTPEASIRALAGEPERVLKQDDGQRNLIYSTQPNGTHCYLVKLDAAGQLTSVEDTLSAAGRDKIVPGITREALFARMCQPIERLLTAHPYEILSWSMEPLDASQPRLFDVYLQNGKVHHTEVRTLYFQAVH